MQKCCWITKAAKRGENPEYCGAPTHYKIETDDSGHKSRKYDSFCEKHQKLFDKQQEDRESRFQAWVKSVAPKSTHNSCPKDFNPDKEFYYKIDGENYGPIRYVDVPLEFQE
jgi:hypothetical protein